MIWVSQEFTAVSSVRIYSSKLCFGVDDVNKFKLQGSSADQEAIDVRLRGELFAVAGRDRACFFFKYDNLFTKNDNLSMHFFSNRSILDLSNKLNKT